MHTSKSSTALLVTMSSAVLATLYRRRIRPLCRWWGATDEEIQQALPGDGIVEQSGPSTTNSVTIAAESSAIWPWLLQMGPGRGGAYTYDWIENLFGLNMHSADRIVPEWQHLEIGDSFALGANGPPLKVSDIDPETFLVFATPDRSWSWSFVLQPERFGITRLITRNRMTAESIGDRVRLEIMLPFAMIMMRRMLLNIKDLVESTPPKARVSEPVLERVEQDSIPT